MELNHLELDSYDDLALLLGKMCLATNEKKKFTEQYRERGKELNDAEVSLIRAKTEEEKPRKISTIYPRSFRSI